VLPQIVQEMVAAAEASQNGQTYTPSPVATSPLLNTINSLNSLISLAGLIGYAYVVGRVHKFGFMNGCFSVIVGTFLPSILIFCVACTLGIALSAAGGAAGAGSF